jgi:3-deoxy-D-manno-octulosonic-acid transferase
MIIISKLIYHLFTKSYFLVIRLAAFFQHKKAKKWVAGRRSIFQKLETTFAFQKDNPEKIIWFHCASLGEFEQGRTLIELLKKENPQIKILLTFFSPSGYEIRKNYQYADWVFYLPADTKKNAIRFIKIVRPAIVVFVKYEFWFNYLHTLNKNKIPVFLIAAVFRKRQLFFKKLGVLHRNMLHFFEHIFVQENHSFQLLKSIKYDAVTITGDPRIDRVLAIANEKKYFGAVEAFCEGSPILVCGSSWPEDEKIMYDWWCSPRFRKWKLIIAPHDVGAERINYLQEMFLGDSLLLSTLERRTADSKKRVLIVDTIGNLSSLYQYGNVAYIGGGFGKDIHNTLEPMAFNLPVLYGPKYQKFTEAVTMIAKDGHFSINSSSSFLDKMAMLEDKQIYLRSTEAVSSYMLHNKGATMTIFDAIKDYL